MQGDIFTLPRHPKGIRIFGHWKCHHRHQVLLAQLAVGYEFLNLYRRDQNRRWTDNRHADIFNRFCELVVKHYRKSREVKFYADLLNLTPKYLSKVIRSATDGITPGEWIE
jgi:hypothetical protein